MNIVMTHATTMAISTKYVGPSDTRGARIKASCEAKSCTVAWQHGKSIEQNHIAAASALAEALEWDGEWTMGSIKDGYVFTRS